MITECFLLLSVIEINHINPSNLLSKYVRKISIFESKNEIIYKQKLTQSAYTYLSFNSKDIPKPIIRNKDCVNVKPLQIVGPKVGEDIYVSYSGVLSQILIEFTATGFYYLFHRSPKEYVNKIINLSEFLTNENINQLESSLGNSSNLNCQIEILEKWLIEKSHKSIQFCDYIDNAVALLEKSNGHFNIAELSNQIFKSERQFERQFNKLVGVAPKNFSKIIQLHHVIYLMQKKDFGTMQDLSYKSNYYDAPSFSKKFKELTGYSPKEFLNSDDHIALKYFTDM